MASVPRLEPDELQNVHENLAAGLSQKNLYRNVNWPTLWYDWHGFEQRIIDNATDEWCKRLWVYVRVKKQLS